MGKKFTPGISVGSSSILVIFVVLCLTTFATLSMVSANSDYRLTSRTAQAAQVYYQADSEGVEQVGALHTALEQLPGGDAAAYRQTAQGLGWTADGLTFRRSVALEGERTLEIAVDASTFAGGGKLAVTQWQVVNHTTWEESPLEVLPGATQGLPQGIQ